MINDERRPRVRAAPKMVTATELSVPQPVAPGLVYSPAGGRRRYMIVVEACPWCNKMHFAWRWVVPSGLIRRRCPTWGRRYLVAPLLVREPGRRRGVIRRAV